MSKVFSQIIGAGIGLWLATLLMPGIVQVMLLADSNFFGIKLTALWEIFLLLAVILGLLNSFVKPILKLLSLPLQIITLGLFSIVISMAMIWVVDVIFKELSVPLFLPLLYTSMLIWISNFIISKILVKDKD